MKEQTRRSFMASLGAVFAGTFCFASTENPKTKVISGNFDYGYLLAPMRKKDSVLMVNQSGTKITIKDIGIIPEDRELKAGTLVSVWFCNRAILMSYEVE